MPKRPTGYFRPKLLDDAIELLARPDTVPLAGGTDLLAGDVEAAVVDLQDLGLDTLEFSSNGLTAGSMTRLVNLMRFLVGSDLSDDKEGPLTGPDLLARAIHQSGPNTYRNAATLGGVIASRLPDSELLATLLVFESQLTIRGKSETIVDLGDYLDSESGPEGLITSISMEWMPGEGASHRVARTPADYPIVSVVAWAPQDGLIRVAATGIDARPVRLKHAEEVLAQGLNPESISKAAEAAHATTRHPGDFRGDTAYRSEMAAVLTRRALNELT